MAYRGLAGTVVVGFVAILLPAACGGGGGGAVAPAGDGGTVTLEDGAVVPDDSGGTGGSGGSGGGSSTPKGGDLPGSSVSCPDATDNKAAIEKQPACAFPENPGCGDGICIPKSLIASQSPDQVDRLAPCNDTDLCVPRAYAYTGGKVGLKKCSAAFGSLSMEGRCVSVCIPQVFAQHGRLKPDVCDPGELCAPCFDPISGSETGACTLGCTEPPDKSVPPPKFPACCGGTGACVTTELAGEQAPQLTPMDCPAPTDLCAPAGAATGVPPKCTSILDNEGRCMPVFVKQVWGLRDALPTEGCDANKERCAPCSDPRNGTPSGACALNGDAPDPAIPTKSFLPCCGGNGMCVPEKMIPTDARASLTPQDCGAGFLCAPAEAVKNPEGVRFPGAAACQTQITAIGIIPLAPGPGACIPECFVPGGLANVGQSTCAAGQKCAPCTHPTENKCTSACGPCPGAPAPPPPACEAAPVP